jgi:hypothetical protein
MPITDTGYDAVASGVPVAIVSGVGTLGASLDALKTDIDTLITDLLANTAAIVSVTPPSPVTATIASSGSLSAAIDIGTMRSIGIIMPATWTTADLTFSVCDTLGGTYSNLYDAAGTEVDIPVAQAKAYTLSAAMTRLIAPWRYIKVRSGTSGAAVNQGGQRIITIVGK